MQKQKCDFCVTRCAMVFHHFAVFLRSSVRLGKSQFQHLFKECSVESIQKLSHMDKGHV